MAYNVSGLGEGWAIENNCLPGRALIKVPMNVMAKTPKFNRTTNDLNAIFKSPTFANQMLWAYMNLVEKFSNPKVADAIRLFALKYFGDSYLKIGSIFQLEHERP